ncbi:helicase-related protein [Corallococcus sp. CA041A]|uniref:helicase-related protein n=1 Tax=Corallococcus sp. CA041A TaxID=2316727 RepID=UPI0011C45271|nr:helicase-related protein [Corallococcus sp. CA041A]
MSFTWTRAADALRRLVAEDAAKPCEEQHLDDGQRASLIWMAERLPQSGVVLADEVGTGKTRLACAVVHAVLDAGGRAAVVVPHGLMHQWAAESRKLRVNSPVPKELTTFTEFLREVSLNEASWMDLSPRPDESEWWLISHGFRAPLVRSNSDEWRAALPAFVELHLASRVEREDGRTRFGKLQRKIENAPASRWGWNGMARIASEVAPRVRGLRDLRKRIESLPPLNVSGWNNDALFAQFGNNGDGRPLTEELLGLWLGEFDLIVIDEAHKSRGEVGVEDTALGAASGTVLARLVDALLKQPESGRRLCLTATPMELELTQWLDLLGRTRSGLDRERGGQVVKRLHDAAVRAAVAPDEGSRLDELCAAARDFTRTLAPHVTRRRRDDDPLVTSFRTGAALSARLPHPHRRLQRVRIGWSETVGQDSPWLNVLFAAECMSQCARGLTLKDTADWPRAVRDAYTKLSAGHVSIDLSETSEPLRVPEPGVVDDHKRGKIARVAYWYRRLRDGRKRVLDGLPPVNGAETDPDAEHPRILAAVEEIERWTLIREKVLVFGVFLRPLRLLRDVLNVRHALRAADAGRPISHDVHTDAALLGIALRQIERMRAKGTLSGRLCAGNGADVRRALSDSHKAYERLRRQVRERAKKVVITWRTDPTLLGGAPADHELESALEDHLVSFVLDDFLATDSQSGEVTHERFDALTAEFVEERLRPLLGELGDEDVDEEQAVLRKEALRALIEDDDGRQSFHARLLQGATRWETRRYLQAAFNRPGASPWVLIAQSQVGREGLNLHESCRVVVQFHAEWNPAILEQQIGRVDRKGSFWERLARKWLDEGAQGEPPFIEVRQLVFEGTYDAFQWDRVMRRQHVFDASLFGTLLPSDAWDRVPQERLLELLAAAPSFRPPRVE